MHDHERSISVVTDSGGSVVQSLAYDVWGRRRNPNGTEDPTGAITAPTTRGYTDHQHLPGGVNGIHLINMNARIYDPEVGRFMSADPTIPDMYSSQSLNRTTYVQNNPGTLIDPTGFRPRNANNYSIYFDRRGYAKSRLEDHSEGEFYLEPEVLNIFELDFLNQQQMGSDYLRLLAGVGFELIAAVDTSQISDSSVDENLVDYIDLLESEIPGVGNSYWACSGQNCRSHGARVWSTSRVDKETGNHYYHIRGEICSQGPQCDDEYADTVYSFVNQNDIPFTSNDSGEGTRVLLPFVFLPVFLGHHPIRHFEDPLSRVSVNIALEGHIFHPGSVSHRVHFEDGKLFYDIVGAGDGGLGKFNNFVGLTQFVPSVKKIANMFGK